MAGGGELGQRVHIQGGQPFSFSGDTDTPAVQVFRFVGRGLKRGGRVVGVGREGVEEGVRRG